MKKIAFITAIMLTMFMINITAFAAVNCPKITNIKLCEFHTVFVDDSNMYSVYCDIPNEKNENSTLYWILSVHELKASSFDDAAKKAKNSLDTISFNHGPIETKHDMLDCVYDTEAKYKIIVSVAKLKK